MKIFIFHFRPIENYPPIQNLVRFLFKRPEIDKIYCFSSYWQKPTLSFGEKVKLYRWGRIGVNKIMVWTAYLLYNFLSILTLILKRPSCIVYFESLSAYPVYFYRRFVNKNARLIIHYHEYTTKEEYKNASIVERFFHEKEKYLYPRADWISHTNSVRLQKFLTDEQIQFDSNIHKVMPNYPSKNWPIRNVKWKRGEVLKMIYVGSSLTEEGSYLKELVDYLRLENIKIELNIYCLRRTELLSEMEGQVGEIEIKVHQTVKYDQLPNILSQHHIGLILYKAKIQNYIHNAPNKLFEYLSCGLDVWYPQEMKGIYDYDSNAQPKVMRLDYNNLQRYKLNQLLQNTGVEGKFTYFAEDVYDKILKAIKNPA